MNGYKEGQGTFYYKAGLKHYEGEWQLGEPHGYKILLFLYLLG